MLPAEVVAAMIARLRGRARAQRSSVDLTSQTVPLPDGSIHAFEIDPFAKHCLLKGLDELGFTLDAWTEIDAFERRYAEPGPVTHAQLDDRLRKEMTSENCDPARRRHRPGGDGAGGEGAARCARPNGARD